MDWISVLEKLPLESGWYAVAILPNNHSGLDNDRSRVDINGDNRWRESFGFSKGWFHDGRFYQPDSHRYGSEEITHRATHWAKLPPVPPISEVFTPPKKYNALKSNTVEYLAENAFSKSGKEIEDKELYMEGFKAAFALMGITD